MSRTWFSSDWHFGHESILDYTQRGPDLTMGRTDLVPEEDGTIRYSKYLSIEVHDAWLVRLINSMVGERDQFYILGDVAFGNQWRAAHLISQINCVHKHLVGGNHDHATSHMDFYKGTDLFESIHDHRLEIKLNGKRIVLDHHPIAEWNNGHHQSWHLHGHSHGNFNYERAGLADKRILDVGWDNSVKVFGYYKPFSFEDVARYMEGRTSIEHHGKAD